jgi:predicted flap endonuclease-1-like 5' DNA nuclease
MSDPVKTVRGMSDEAEAKLKEAGIAHIDQFLQAGCDPASRKALAAKLDVDPKFLLELLNRADLARIKGIGTVFANLLEEAGVDTVKELATRVPENLHAKLEQVNADKKLAHHVPNVAEVKAWVAEAKELPKILTY